MDDKTILKKTKNGRYYMEIPSDYLRITKWKEGDTIELIPGRAVTSKKDDLILRKVI